MEHTKGKTGLHCPICYKEICQGDVLDTAYVAKAASQPGLLAACKEYGRHKDSCALVIPPSVLDTLGPGCTCGFDKAIAKAEPDENDIDPAYEQALADEQID